ncbi:hypothetical protein SAMN06296386_106153 [Lachnospiraceae bacterium]|nr:hypothetical protein SAMN06296386_106153 [Lachnospiraceae bacterium]
MKKQIWVKLLAVAMTGALLSGCGFDFSSKNDDSFEEASEASDDEDSEETSKESEEDKDDLRGEDLYDAFMKGEVKVVYNKLSNEAGDALKDYLENGKEYDINEIIKCAEEGDYTSRTLAGDPKASFIDCGEDGVKELLVKMDFGASSSLSMILKDIDGKLRICYSGESWDRSELSIGDTGMISSSGSGGATVHGYDESFVNADGEYKFFYSCMTEGDPYSYYAYTSDDDYEKLSFDDLETQYFMINSYCVKDDNGHSTYYYNYDMLDEDYNPITTDSDFAASNPYRKKFAEAGITVYTRDEIDDILAKKAEEIEYPGGYKSESSVGLLVSKEHVDNSGLSAEEQLTEDHCISDETGDVTEKVDGIKGSSLDGHLNVSRIYNDENKPVFLFKLDGKNVGNLVMDSADYNNFNYIQLKDTDGDGMEEILVVTYTYSTGPVVAVDFSVLKCVSSQNEADGSSYGVIIDYHPYVDLPYGNGYSYIEADEELAGGTVTYVSLEDNGVQVVVDKGTKIDAVYYPDEYVLTMKYC